VNVLVTLILLLIGAPVVPTLSPAKQTDVCCCDCPPNPLCPESPICVKR
jgi:hypothetical protein